MSRRFPMPPVPAVRKVPPLRPRAATAAATVPSALPAIQRSAWVSVTLAQMIATLPRAVDRPATGVRIVEVPQIRSASLE